VSLPGGARAAREGAAGQVGVRPGRDRAHLAAAGHLASLPGRLACRQVTVGCKPSPLVSLGVFWCEMLDLLY
jgi:hypothetical protein